MTSPSPGRLILTPGRIAHLVITAPAARNAMSSAMWRALPDLMRTLAAEPGCRALILSGAGGCFSAGADISEFEAIYASPESALAANASVRGRWPRCAICPCPSSRRSKVPALAAAWRWPWPATT